MVERLNAARDARLSIELRPPERRCRTGVLCDIPPLATRAIREVAQTVGREGVKQHESDGGRAVGIHGCQGEGIGERHIRGLGRLKPATQLNDRVGVEVVELHRHPAGIVRPMPPNHEPAAIIFDLDGTLVDTVPDRIAAWAEALGERSISVTADDLRPMIGMDGRRLAREVTGRDGPTLSDDEAEELDRRSGELFDKRNTDPRPLPGARSLLAALDERRVTWAIATSSRPEQVARSLVALGLGREPRVVDGSHVEHAKPAPDLLLLAASELGTDPAAAWYVGDSTWDMQAAVAAGMRGIGVLAGSAVSEDALREAGAREVVETLDLMDLEG